MLQNDSHSIHPIHEIIHFAQFDLPEITQTTLPEKST